MKKVINKRIQRDKKTNGKKTRGIKTTMQQDKKERQKTMTKKRV